MTDFAYQEPRNPNNNKNNNNEQEQPIRQNNLFGSRNLDSANSVDLATNFGLNIYNKIISGEKDLNIQKELNKFLASYNINNITIIETPFISTYSPHIRGELSYIEDDNGKFQGGTLTIPTKPASNDPKAIQRYCDAISHELEHAINISKNPNMMKDIMDKNNVSRDDMENILKFYFNVLDTSDFTAFFRRAFFAYVYIDMHKNGQIALMRSYQEDINKYGTIYPENAYKNSIKEKVELAITNFSALIAHLHPNLQEATPNQEQMNKELHFHFGNICNLFAEQTGKGSENMLNAFKDFIVCRLKNEARAYSVNSNLNKKIQGIEQNSETINDVIPTAYNIIANMLENTEITVKNGKIFLNNIPTPDIQ